jgi:hypothetical protein
MKKNKNGSKLSFNKTTVSDLDLSTMNDLRGGMLYSREYTSVGVEGCYCDSEHFCTCGSPCPIM